MTSVFVRNLTDSKSIVFYHSAFQQQRKAMLVSGTTVVIEFEKNGESHRTIQWSTSNEILGENYINAVRKQYEASGAVVVQISKVERIQVALL